MSTTATNCTTKTDEKRREEHNFKLWVCPSRKSNLARDIDYNKVPGIDHEQLANVISDLVIQLPGVEDAATLVTDEEVLIAYEAEKNRDRFETADMVKKQQYPPYQGIIMSMSQTSRG